jgi:hypothetical protein
MDGLRDTPEKNGFGATFGGISPIVSDTSSNRPVSGTELAAVVAFNFLAFAS